MTSMPYGLPASGFCHTSMNSTFIRPAYSFFNSSRMGAIILQGIHLPAPKSRSFGSLALATGAAGSPVFSAGALVPAARTTALVSAGALLWFCLRTMAAATVTASAATMAIFSGVFIISFVLAGHVSREHRFDFVHRRHLAAELHLAIHDERGRHHHAERHDLLQVGDFFEFAFHAERLSGFLRRHHQRVALSAAGAEDLDFHGAFNGSHNSGRSRNWIRCHFLCSRHRSHRKWRGGWLRRFQDAS